MIDPILEDWIEPWTADKDADQPGGGEPSTLHHGSATPPMLRAATIADPALRELIHAFATDPDAHAHAWSSGVISQSAPPNDPAADRPGGAPLSSRESYQILVAVGLSPGRFAGVTLLHDSTREPFSPEDAALAAALIRGLRSWIDRLHRDADGWSQAVAALPPRERRLLACLSRGQSAKDIARELGLTVDTVRTYTKSLYRRLGISGRTQLRAQVQRLGPSGESATPPPTTQTSGNGRLQDRSPARPADHKMATSIAPVEVPPSPRRSDDGVSQSSENSRPATAPRPALAKPLPKSLVQGVHTAAVTPEHRSVKIAREPTVPRT